MLRIIDPPVRHLARWQIAFRRGFAPLMTVAELQALATALETDDPRLIQGTVTTPPPVLGRWQCQGGCAIGLAAMLAGYATVQAVVERFAEICHGADARLDEPVAARWFLTWVDNVSRETLRNELLPEVRRALAARVTVDHLI